MNSKPEILRNQYRLRFEPTHQYRAKVWRVLCEDFFYKYVGKQSRVLDLGAGWGEFINALEAAEKWAMDLNPETKLHLKPGVNFILQDCSESWPLESGTLDAVVASNFLEHLPDRPAAERAIAEAYRCLRESGVILCLGPNIKYTRGRYWDFWDHQIPITERSCSELLQMNGFRIEEIRSKFLPYTMSHGFRPPLLLLRIYLRCPVLWRCFGQQFLVVGRKTASKSGPTAL